MYKIYKRLIDIVIAGVALVILSPLMVIVMIVLIFTGEHEIFYFQKRVGYKNKQFYIWKFASMLKNSVNMGTGAITLRHDPRVTRVGKILRMTKINELPQIMNVLKGDMSIVGPRPLLQQSFELYSDDVKLRIYNWKPGITGIGSIIFRDEEKLLSASPDPKAMYARIYPYKGALEMWYQDHITFYTDCKIMFLTGWCILFPETKLTDKIFKDLPVRTSF